MAETANAKDVVTEPLPLGQRGRAAAGAVAWRPSRPPASADTAQAKRLRGTIQATVGLCAAGVLMFCSMLTFAAVVAGVALVMWALALLSPLRAYAAVDLALTRFGRSLGLVVGWVALTPVYLLFFVPFGLLFKRGANDPMRRALAPHGDTYWRERPADDDVLERVRRPF